MVKIIDTMAQNLVFDIKIREGQNIQFIQESTFENFIGQFQQNCSQLLCVINGTSLRVYSKIMSLPTNIRFDYKQRRKTLTEYYFRNIDDGTSYCVFGREAAIIFYPRIDEVDPGGKHELSRDDVFGCPESKREPITLDNSSFYPVAKKRSPIIQEIPKTSLPLFHESVRGQLTKNEYSIKEHTINQPCKLRSNIAIIDGGLKLTFPNPDYPIKIKTYYPS